MWMVEQIEFGARDLDFSSAGLGRHATTSVLADGTEIVNALDLVVLTATNDEPTLKGRRFSRGCVSRSARWRPSRWLLV